jgi:hypothetical protein
VSELFVREIDSDDGLCAQSCGSDALLTATAAQLDVVFLRDVVEYLGLASARGFWSERGGCGREFIVGRTSGPEGLEVVASLVPESLLLAFVLGH